MPRPLSFDRCADTLGIEWLAALAQVSCTFRAGGDFARRLYPSSPRACAHWRAWHEPDVVSFKNKAIARAKAAKIFQNADQSRRLG
jgi:hypothetical protein